jgi:hypothetical protein
MSRLPSFAFIGVVLGATLAGCAESHTIDDGVIRACSVPDLYESIYDADAGVVEQRLRTEADCDFAPCEVRVEIGGVVRGCRLVLCTDGHPRAGGGCEAAP